MSDLLELSLADVQAGLRNKTFSCTELTNAYLQQIEKTDEKVKSYITVLSEQATKRAAAIDAKIINGESLAPLAGIPGAIKDVLATKGVKTTAATNILKNYIAPYNATAIARLDEAEYVNLGKVNCDAFAHGGSTENSDFFTTGNPWDVSRIPGGSSGGSASSVAARQALFSLGTDTGGSVRYPAGHCGVVGLKPTYGRVSRYGLFSMCSSTDTVGVMGRQVADVAAVLQTIAGRDSYDATSADVTVDSYVEALKDVSIKGKKIGIPKEYFAEGLDDRVKERVQAAIADLAKQGAELVEVSLPNMEYGIAAYYVLMSSEVSSNLARYDGIRFGYSINKDESNTDKADALIDVFKKSRKYGLGPEAKRRVMLGTYSLSSGYYDQYYHKAAQVRALIKNDFIKVFDEVDLLATPVAASVPFKIGEKTSPLEMYLEDSFMVGASLAGVPALSVPAGFIEEDGKPLPVGLQLIGNYFSESLLFQVASVYEALHEWYKKVPDLR